MRQAPTWRAVRTRIRSATPSPLKSLSIQSLFRICHDPATVLAAIDRIERPAPASRGVLAELHWFAGYGEERLQGLELALAAIREGN